MVNFLAVIEVLIALTVLAFLFVTFLYLVAPQSLDAFLRRIGIQRGIGVLNARNVFAVLRQLGLLLLVLGLVTLAMIFFQAWPRGWLIPAIQELVMAAILFLVGYLGVKGKQKS